MGQLLGLMGFFGFLACVIMAVGYKVKKKPAKSYALGSVAFFVLFVVGAKLDTKKDKENENQDNTQIVENVEVKEMSTTESVEVTGQDNSEEKNAIIYELNEGINEYIIAFNKANPNDQITSEMAKPYYHHGSEHNDQIEYTVNDYKVVITGGAKVYVGYTPNVRHTKDEYKEMFIKYLRGFELGLTDEEIEKDWDLLMDDLTHSESFEKYQASITMDLHDSISYFVIELRFTY